MWFLSLREVTEQDAENIWTYKVGSNKRMEKTV
jgi:hypothetical protein